MIKYKNGGTTKRDLSYLKNKPIAVLGSGAVGKTIAADSKLGGSEVRLYGSEEFKMT